MALNQKAFHAYDQNGSYVGVVVATEQQLADAGFAAGSEPPPQPAPVPNLSFAQLLIGLVTEAWITEADGNGWLTGTLPAAVTAVINTLPESHRFAAKARALRPSEVLRADPLVAAMGTAAGKTSAEIDTFFQTYAGV